MTTATAATPPASDSQTPRKPVSVLRQALRLTRTEFSLLEELARSAGQVVSKQDLSLNALGCPLTRYDRRIDVHISSIRQKLGPRPDAKAWIQSVRGLGYLLIAE